jgi:chromosome partitioning protein
MKIAVLAKKGGVGKSAVSVLLYEAFRQAGKTVFIHDWDAQGTSTKAMNRIDGQPSRTNNHKADITIFDTPPSLEHTATATAVRNADIVLVITSPAPADIWEAEEAVQFARSKNSQAVIRVAVNKYRERTLLGRVLEDNMKDVKAPYLPIMLNTRECYQHVFALGWKALDSSAREEVLQFAVSLLSLK